MPDQRSSYSGKLGQEKASVKKVDKMSTSIDKSKNARDVSKLTRGDEDDQDVGISFNPNLDILSLFNNKAEQIGEYNSVKNTG